MRVLHKIIRYNSKGELEGYYKGYTMLDLFKERQKEGRIKRTFK